MKNVLALIVLLLANSVAASPLLLYAENKTECTSHFAKVAKPKSVTDFLTTVMYGDNESAVAFYYRKQPILWCSPAAAKQFSNALLGALSAETVNSDIFAKAFMLATRTYIPSFSEKIDDITTGSSEKTETLAYLGDLTSGISHKFPATTASVNCQYSSTVPTSECDELSKSAQSELALLLDDAEKSTNCLFAYGTKTCVTNNARLATYLGMFPPDNSFAIKLDSLFMRVADSAHNLCSTTPLTSSDIPLLQSISYVRSMQISKASIRKLTSLLKEQANSTSRSLCLMALTWNALPNIAQSERQKLWNAMAAANPNAKSTPDISMYENYGLSLANAIEMTATCPRQPDIHQNNRVTAKQQINFSYLVSLEYDGKRALQTIFCDD